MSVEPFIRDDGQGQPELVIPTGQGGAVTVPLSVGCAWRLVKDLLPWLGRSRKAGDTWQ